MRAKVIGLAVMLVFTSHCGSRNANKDSRIYTLSSGKQIKVKDVKKMNFAEFSSLAIYYETEIPLRDKKTLHKEVADVWSVFQKDAERAEATVGIIQATSYRLGGLVRETKQYGFVLSKRDGKWHFVEEDWFTEDK